MKNREGIIKEPKFANSKEKLEFYRNLQNPQTGAFMDDSYPLFTYIAPTSNVLYYIESLSKEVGEPLGLKYPLKFLDKINTPEKLEAFLDDLSTVGWLGSKFRTTYVVAAEFTYYQKDMERTGLYSFSPQWKKAMLYWFYKNQDSKTGFWGAKLRGSGKLLDTGDLVSTEKIMKLFADDQGNTIHSQFPLRYKEKIFATTLQKISLPMPEDLDDVHEWILIRDRGTRLLTKYLWNGASLENKNLARKLIEDTLRNRFKKFYVESEGSFSLYPGAKHADLDGTGEALGYLENSELGVS